jgi:hypothetical protein
MAIGLGIWRKMKSARWRSVELEFSTEEVNSVRLGSRFIFFYIWTKPLLKHIKPLKIKYTSKVQCGSKGQESTYLSKYQDISCQAASNINL